jgi:alpha-D-xyloside xylohydrolase
MKTILQGYTGITGAPAVPPKWTFGVWLSRCTYESQEEVETVAREARERAIPADVIHVDTGWFEHEWVCDWRFGSRFPDPRAMIDRLAELGFKVTLWQWPYVGINSPAFNDLVAAGALARRRGGYTYLLAGGNTEDVAVIDYSNPDALRWIDSRLGPLFDLGVAAFKADFGEGAPPDAIYHGLPGESMHNAYPLLYNRAIWEASERARGRGNAVVWSRSAWAGSQRYPVHWSGDGVARFEDLACVLRSALSFGVSGFPFYSHDIGGWVGVPSPELFVRWAQLGLFSSHSRLHGLGPREPWLFGAEAETIFRRYADLRYRLMPYIYSEAIECGRTSLPMVRALALEYQADPNALTIDDEYLFGGSLLVAPILQESNQRMVYLPPGSWFDFWTKERLVGSRWITVEAPISTLPLFVRGGSIIPFGPLVSHVDEKPLDPLHIEVYGPTERGSYVVHDDAAEISIGYQRRGDDLVVQVEGAPGAVDVAIYSRSGSLDPIVVRGTGTSLALHVALRTIG